MNHTDQLRCSFCSTTNTEDSRYCQSCGKEIVLSVMKCKRCGTSNGTSATFCKSCGTQLADATLGITPDRAARWWGFFCEVDFYNQLWVDKAIGRQVHDKCLALRNEKYPDINWESVALAIPVVSSNWSIQFVDVKRNRVTSGLILCTTTATIIFDLLSKQLWQIFYRDIKSIEFQDWIMCMALHTGEVIKFHIKEPGTASTTTGIIVRGVLDVISIFSDNHSSADRAGSDYLDHQAVDELRQKYDVGVNFWERVRSFYNEIFSHA